jgi:hypothetical protein
MFATSNQEELTVFVRVVRFTDVDANRMEEMLRRINDSAGPPPGVTALGIRVLFDDADGTAVVLQEFATADDMSAAAKVFDAMDASETPGTRASIDACEQKLELAAP